MSTVVTCPNSLVCFLPATIYKFVGALDVLPELVASLDRSKPPTVQFLRNEAVRTASCDDVASL